MSNWLALRGSAMKNKLPYLCLWLVAFALSFLCIAVDSASQIEVHRLLQAEIDGTAIGSRSTKISTFATLPSANARVFHTVVLVPLQLATADVIAGLIGKKAGADGILLILPPTGSLLSAEEEENLVQVQKTLLENPTQVAVYFAYEEPLLSRMIKDIDGSIKAGNPPSVTSSRYEVFVSGVDVSEIKTPQSISYVGWLPAIEGTPLSHTTVPTIAITAHYDTFSMVPSLAFGSDANGSGVNILLHIMKVFKKLYQSTGTRGKYNLVFLLTSGGPFSFEGTRRWLNDADGSFLESIDFALCLDSLSIGSGGNKLYLHYAKPPKDEQTQAWYDTIKSSGTATGLPVEEVHKKVNISASAAHWEHEQFSKRRITAATLSARSAPSTPFMRSSVDQNYRPANISALVTVVELLAKALTKAVFPELPASTDLVSIAQTKQSLTSSVEQWAKVLGTTPRMYPYFTANHPLHAAFQQHFKTYADSSVRHLWKFDSARFRFFNGTTASMSVFRTSSILYDMVLFLAVSFYLLFLFAALRVGTRGWSELVSLFQTSRNTKYKRS